MKLKLIREDKTDVSTIGKLFINDIYFCDTLEDVEREEKIHGQTAIDKGIYTVIMSFSNRFQVYMPQLLNVPKFKGIRIHAGNTHKDTHGCILVGKKTDNKDFITASKITYNKLLAEIKKVEKKEKITIEII
jgi:hypothetical protein